MVFSMSQMDMSENMQRGCNPEEQNNNQSCSMTCCLDTTTIEANSIASHNILKKVIKDIEPKKILNFIGNDYYKEINQYLYKKNPPSNISKSIENYSYHTLTNIIKLNI